MWMWLGEVPTWVCHDICGAVCMWQRLRVASCCTRNRVVQWFCQLADKRYVTFVEKCVNLGQPIQIAKLVMWWWCVVCVCGWESLERWPCQLGFGIWVASQMHNQVDR